MLNSKLRQHKMLFIIYKLAISFIFWVLTSLLSNRKIQTSRKRKKSTMNNIFQLYNRNFSNWWYNTRCPGKNGALRKFLGKLKIKRIWKEKFDIWWIVLPPPYSLAKNILLRSKNEPAFFRPKFIFLYFPEI